MATRIRLSRRGRKKFARYDIVVADSRSPRDGKFIEKIGLFNPHGPGTKVELNAEKALKWVMNGAQPSDTARQILSEEGIMLRKHLQVGVNKGAITQEQADKKFQAWKEQKDKQTEASTNALTQKQAEERKARLAAEAKVSEARKAAQQAKLTPPAEEAPAEAPAAEGSEEQAAE